VKNDVNPLCVGRRSHVSLILYHFDDPLSEDQIIINI